VSSCAGYTAKRQQRLPEETLALIVVAVVVVSLVVRTLLVEIEIEYEIAGQASCQYLKYRILRTKSAGRLFNAVQRN
jgi:hypothetical protein